MLIGACNPMLCPIWGFRSATLIVVPDHMVEHWATQIRMCVVPLAGGDAQSGLDATIIEETAEKAAGGAGWKTVRRTAYFDFDDAKTSKKLPLPPAAVLAERWAVVVSAARLASAELSVDSPLFEVNWHRLLVDEGDTIGAGTALSGPTFTILTA